MSFLPELLLPDAGLVNDLSRFGGWEMERPISGILRRSSDAAVIIGLADGRVLDVNEAFFTLTGHTRQELVGRPGHDVFLGLGQPTVPTAAEVLGDLGWFVNVSTGL